jgi:hypothetical protein
MKPTTQLKMRPYRDWPSCDGKSRPRYVPPELFQAVEGGTITVFLDPIARGGINCGRLGVLSKSLIRPRSGAAGMARERVGTHAVKAIFQPCGNLCFAGFSEAQIGLW